MTVEQAQPVASLPSKIGEVLYVLARYFVAFVILNYAFAKINGSQFTILDSELDKPMGQVSGFWLTWYYFGYSHFYGNFIALVQAVGGILLMFRRTTLLGACILFGVIGNIILINIFYSIALDALFVSLLLETLLASILLVHHKELWNTFWAMQNRIVPEARRKLPAQIGVNAIRLTLIVIPIVFTYYLANYNNRYPTVIDGSWDVVSVSGADHPVRLPITFFFEYNRAYKVVFKYADGTYIEHHFELEGDDHIQMWETWLDKGDRIFDGSYELNEDTLVLNSSFADQEAPIEITLKKRTTSKR